MAFNGYAIVSPSYMVPEIAVNQSQKSGAFGLLPGEAQDVRLNQTDLFAYIKTLQVATHLDAGQAAAEQLSSPSFVTELKQTPTYMMRLRYEYNHLDMANAANWNVSLPEAYRLAGWQTFAQNERNALLNGFQGGEGEGILNTPGITEVTLPPDTNGDTTFSTYDNGHMGFFFQSQIVDLQIRQYLSLQSGNLVVVLGPQRIMSNMLKANIVQLVQFQRQGAGTQTTGGMISEVFNTAGDNIEWRVDDTLQGAGPGGADVVILASPELEDQKGSFSIDTNAFAKITPNLNDNITMFADMVAPREMTVPLPGGAVDTTCEKRITSGYVVRPEAFTLLYIPY